MPNKRQSATSLDLTPGNRINQRQRATPGNELTRLEQKVKSEVEIRLQV